MGERGPGAGKLRLARELAATTKAKEPWKKKGLTRAQRVIAFCESLPITKGKLAGKKLKLLPGQREFIEEVYGPKRIRIAIKSEPRGNGKTGLLAPLALAHLLGPEAEVRGEVYSAAIDRKQAGILFAEMEAIILTNPHFAARVSTSEFHKTIKVNSGDGEGSVYEALSSDARRGHGLSPSLWVYDELAQAKDRELLDNLITAMGKRNNSLGIIISTQAPTDNHPLSQLIDDAPNEPSTYVQLKSAPVDADAFSIDTLRSVNPAWGIFLDIEDVMAEARRAKRLAAFEPAFRNLRLNQRVDANQELRIVNSAVWRLGATPVDLDRLRGRRCYGGLDLSSKHDLTAFVLVFPDDEAEPSYDIVPYFWTPSGAMEGRRHQEQDLFREWIKGEHLEEMQGPTVRFKVVAERIVALSRLFDIQSIAYDRWRIDDLKADLADIGAELPLEPFGQGFQSMGPALEFFAECALTGRLNHGGHPVLTANVASAIVVSDPAGNMKFDKDKSNKTGTTRIDGAQALAMALGIARRQVGEEVPVDLDDFIKNAVMA
ncbi:terminase [Brevundimonas intermedia]|uniref:Terminase n=1 Tax=Brevundimonas intermedia TaxID=74315 RepID=A0ABQ5TAZ4_9CAUL|nr:terminase TerL endonuclease subunit [Brevundimonas intermedia]GLK49501.1 terminase [Brevundimonas intermedia]